MVKVYFILVQTIQQVVCDMLLCSVVAFTVKTTILIGDYLDQTKAL